MLFWFLWPWFLSMSTFLRPREQCEAHSLLPTALHKMCSSLSSLHELSFLTFFLNKTMWLKNRERTRNAKRHGNSNIFSLTCFSTDQLMKLKLRKLWINFKDHIVSRIKAGTWSQVGLTMPRHFFKCSLKGVPLAYLWYIQISKPLM